MQSHREGFEERAFHLYFIKTIKSAVGATMTQAELCKRDGNGEYVDQDLRHLWAGWQLAIGGHLGDIADDIGAQVAYEVIAEREHQRRRFSAEKDDLTSGELALAAAAYALQAARGSRDEPLCWPGGVLTWKPRDPYKNLVRAGALVMAELERQKRAGQRKGDRDIPSQLPAGHRAPDRRRRGHRAGRGLRVSMLR